MIRAIIFDFFGVLCNDLGTEWYKRRLPQEDVSELQAEYDKPVDMGEITEGDFFETIGSLAGTSGEAVRTEWINTAQINHELVDFIRSLKPDYKLAVCSNASPEFFRDILRIGEIKGLFDTVICSAEIGMAKPHPDIFRYALEQLEVEASEAIFIDDRLENVEASKSIGMEAVLYTDLESLRCELENRLA